MMRALILALCLAFGGAAQAASTVNSLPPVPFPLRDPGDPATSNDNVWITQGNTGQSDHRVTPTQLGYVYQGITAPQHPFPFQYWWDTSGAPTTILRLYSGTTWVQAGTFNTTTSAWTPTASAPAANPIVANNGALIATSGAAFPLGVWRAGFAAQGDAPPQFYRPLSGNCVANGWANALGTGGDNGACVDASNGNSWLAVWGEMGLDLAQWGGTPLNSDPELNDKALDNAFNWVCKAKSTVRIAQPKQANVYAIARTHVLGNGSNIINSTCNNVAVISEPDNLENAAGQQNSFVWVGPTGPTPVFTFKGPMAGVKVQGLSVDCAAVCTTGIRVNNTINSQFLRLSVTRNINGPGIILDAEPVNAWLGALEGTYFRTIITTASGLGGSGVQIGSTTAPAVPGCQMGVGWDLIDDLNVSWDSSTAGTYGIALGGATQLTITHGRVFPYNATTNAPTNGGLGESLIVSSPPCDYHTPSNIEFNHVQFGKTPKDPPSSGPTAWTPAVGEGIRFLNYSEVYAAKPVSTTFGAYWGETAKGEVFPGATPWAPALQFGGLNVGMAGTGVGQFLRNGQQYHVEYRITLTAKGSSVGAATVAGFPYVQNSTTGTTGSVFGLNMTLTAANAMQSIIGAGTSIIGLYTQGRQAINTDFNDNSVVIGSIEVMR